MWKHNLNPKVEILTTVIERLVRGALAIAFTDFAHPDLKTVEQIKLGGTKCRGEDI